MAMLYYNCMWQAGKEGGVTRCSMYGNAAPHAELTANMGYCAMPKPTSKPTSHRSPLTYTQAHHPQVI